MNTKNYKIELKKVMHEKFISKFLYFYLDILAILW